MSFDDYDGPEGQKLSSQIERCKPDYEAQAANIKKKLDATVELEAALFKFKNSTGVGSFRNISSFAEFIGGVVIKKSEYSASYDELLKQIEKTD